MSTCVFVTFPCLPSRGGYETARTAFRTGTDGSASLSASTGAPAVSSLRACIRSRGAATVSTARSRSPSSQKTAQEQLRTGLAEVSVIQGDELVVAYEPVWAIGTGRTATPAQVREVHQLIRHRLSTLFAREAADAIRILYGGSVSPETAHALFALPDVDGGLVGGASLDAARFAAIVAAAGAP